MKTIAAGRITIVLVMAALNPGAFLSTVGQNLTQHKIAISERNNKIPSPVEKAQAVSMYLCIDSCGES